MNNYDLTYLKEYLNTYYQTKDGYIMSYDEVDKLYHYIEKVNNIIKEVKEEIRILESNCDINEYQAQKLYQLIDKGEDKE